MTPKELLALIRRHLRKTKEAPSAFGRRVMHDQAFLWKLKNQQRVPRAETIRRIRLAIQRKEKRIEVERAVRAAAKVGIISLDR